MASDLDFSPPEVPEPTFLENLLRYGLFLGAIFQLICVLAIIVPVPKSHEVLHKQYQHQGTGLRSPELQSGTQPGEGLACLLSWEDHPGVPATELGLYPWCLSWIAGREAEPSEPRSAEVMRKPKTTAPANKRPKKEAKKKR
ncbi:protein MANBAL isoform X1 [Manis pentadactyla]|uniref:protein MANBAL isoform X1 n=1 Tax=Manis pentadactyla TaxID=143292 RepID=UPI0018756F4E|nr:protein MANBAL isoform X1 [Manis pentadactyla]